MIETNLGVVDGKYEIEDSFNSEMLLFDSTLDCCFLRFSNFFSKCFTCLSTFIFSDSCSLAFILAVLTDSWMFILKFSKS